MTFSRKRNKILLNQSLGPIALFLEPMLLEDPLVFLGLVHLEVREDLSTLCDLPKEPATSGMILLMLMEMLCEFTNLLREDGDLHLRRSRILIMKTVFRDEPLLL